MRERSDMAIVKAGETMLNTVDALRELDGGRVEEVSNHLDVSPSTAYRHLNTLKNHGYVVKHGDEYRVGKLFLTVGGYARNQITSYHLLSETVNELAESTGERAQFMIEEHGLRITVSMRSGDHAVQAGKYIGHRNFLHSSAAGKAILAELPSDRIETILAEHGMPPQTENSIRTEERLFEELAQIREQGFALNDEESTSNLRAVGTTIHGSTGRLLGAISVSGPKRRIKGQKFESELPDLLMGKVNELELKIEYDE